MLRAGSLYFAIFISFIITLLLASIIMYAYYSNGYTNIQAMSDQVEANAGSGITLALYDTSLLATGSEDVFSLYDEDDSIDDVTVTKAYWGIYQVIKSTARWKNYEIIKTALVGTDLATSEAVAMYVADKDRYLSFSGETDITGTCYFPKLGVRMAYIEGRSFTGNKLVKGEIKTSAKELPALQHNVLGVNLAYFRDTIPMGDSLISFKEIMGMDSLERSFTGSTITIHSPGPVTLDHISLKGNIRVLSSKSIYVSKNFKADNIIIYAPSIYFERGFIGNLQAFAQDTIIAGEDCEFTYPSCLGLINENINGIYLALKENTVLAGSIFIYQENKATNVPYLKLSEHTIVHGQVYCPGTVEFRGKIEGSLYCHSFALKTFSAYYENHLLNVTIDRSALSDYYSGSFLLPVYKYAKNIQWLN
jgi:hypothetical protein